MRLHETTGARSMQSQPQAQIDSRPEPSPMAIIGAILAQGAIRYLDRQKRDRRTTKEERDEVQDILKTELQKIKIY
jgi:hypothetical protein